jgi:hypothetical protein
MSEEAFKHSLNCSFLVFPSDYRSVDICLRLLSFCQLGLVQFPKLRQTGGVQVRAGRQNDQRRNRHRKKELKDKMKLSKYM